MAGAKKADGNSLLQLLSLQVYSWLPDIWLLHRVEKLTFAAPLPEASFQSRSRYCAPAYIRAARVSGKQIHTSFYANARACAFRASLQRDEEHSARSSIR